MKAKCHNIYIFEHLYEYDNYHLNFYIFGRLRFQSPRLPEHCLHPTTQESIYRTTQDTSLLFYLQRMLQFITMFHLVSLISHEYVINEV